ncbi:MAG: hypothetical protein ACP5UB_10130, partial [Candidatus Sumerlaeaceae bacterium]
MALRVGGRGAHRAREEDGTGGLVIFSGLTRSSGADVGKAAAPAGAATDETASGVGVGVGCA